jgi:citrate lyase subunit beta/citryl-CoA lyase
LSLPDAQCCADAGNPVADDRHVHGATSLRYAAAPMATASGIAGRKGDDVRSDAWVAVELRDSGGIQVELASRVEPYYGRSIREQAAGLLASAGVRDARVEIADSGALPFVLAARIGAALGRAGLEAPPVNGDAAPRAVPARFRPRRSRLYLPGNEPKFFINAGLHEPDAVILDLEDSVHADEKDAARLLVRNALRAVDFRGAERMVRINQLPLGLEDLAAVLGERPDLILIPKVETADQVREVALTLDAAGSGLPTPWLMPILESALGIENAFDIARASERIVALTLAEGDESAYARARVVNAARAAGVQPIDSVYGQVDDLDGLARWGERSRRMGYVGMGCLHPRQIAVIHRAYAPTAAEIDRALRIVAASAEASAKGLAVVSLGSKMIDPPVIEQARRVVEQAQAQGLLPQGAA